MSSKSFFVRDMADERSTGDSSGKMHVSLCIYESLLCVLERKVQSHYSVHHVTSTGGWRGGEFRLTPLLLTDCIIIMYYYCCSTNSSFVQLCFHSALCSLFTVHEKNIQL